MKVLLDISDRQAPFIMRLLRELSGVKATTIVPARAQLLKELKEAVDNLNKVGRGKLKARPARELFDEI